MMFSRLAALALVFASNPDVSEARVRGDSSKEVESPEQVEFPTRNNELMDNLKYAKMNSPTSDLKRFVSSRECGAQITITTTDELQYLAEFFITFLGADPKSEEFDILGVGLLYDVVVAKVCMSCAMLDKIEIRRTRATTSKGGGSKGNDDDEDFGFGTYCAPDGFGYNALHSALVMAPIDPSTGEIFGGVLRGFVGTHGTEVEVNQCPSEQWPESVGVLLADPNIAVYNYFRFRNLYAGAFAASSGTVSVLPDYIGYGESTQFNRSYVAPLPYQQAVMTSFVAAQNWVYETSGGCSQLDDVVTVTGYSEGGYAAIVGAQALDDKGVKVLSVHPGGTPYDVDRQVQFGVCKYISIFFVLCTTSEHWI
jgi:hypothetical protein